MKILLAVLITALSLKALGQKSQTESKSLTLNVGRSDGISPTFGYNYTSGFDLSLEYKPISHVAIFLSPGYNLYHLNEGYIEDYLAYYTFKSGVKVFPRRRFYLSLAAGMAVGTLSEFRTYPFVLAPAVGFRAKKFDFSLRYEHMNGRIVDYLDEIERPSQLGLRISYGFSLNSK